MADDNMADDNMKDGNMSDINAKETQQVIPSSQARQSLAPIVGENIAPGSYATNDDRDSRSGIPTISMAESQATPSVHVLAVRTASEAPAAPPAISTAEARALPPIIATRKFSAAEARGLIRPTDPTDPKSGNIARPPPRHRPPPPVFGMTPDTCGNVDDETMEEVKRYHRKYEAFANDPIFRG